MGRILPVFYFYGLLGPFVTQFFTATPIKQTGHQLTVESKGNKSTKHGRSDLSHRQKASVHILDLYVAIFPELYSSPWPAEEDQVFICVFATVCLQLVRFPNYIVPK